MLNERQQIGLDLLLGDEPCFITGDAGTGKSTLIQEWLKQEKRDYAICASTGVAAVNIGGSTFHSLFKIPPNGTAAQAISKDPDCSYDGFIVDEVSMLDGTLLNIANTIAQYQNLNMAPFGGMRPIFVGDFFQLPPVNSRFWAFESAVWEHCDLVHFKLTEQMRNDGTHLLNKIKRSNIDYEVIDWLDSRVQTPPDDTPHVFGLNKDVDAYNDYKLNALKGSEVCYNTVYSGYYRKFPIPETLRLKVGAVVMFRKNSDLYVNGTVGTVINLKPLTIQTSCGIIRPTRETFTYRSNGKVFTATNYPICLAWATTIHKSQGATLDRVYVDLTNVWDPGQAYVALSRAKRMDQVFISGWSKEAFQTDPKVLKFYEGF